MSSCGSGGNDIQLPRLLCKWCCQVMAASMHLAVVHDIFSGNGGFYKKVLLKLIMQGGLSS